MVTWSDPCATSPHQGPPPWCLPPSATPDKTLGLIQCCSLIHYPQFLPPLEPPDALLEHKAYSEHSFVTGKALAHHHKESFPSTLIVSPWLASKSSIHQSFNWLEYYCAYTCPLNNIFHHLSSTFPTDFCIKNKQPAYLRKIYFPSSWTVTPCTIFIGGFITLELQLHCWVKPQGHPQWRLARIISYQQLENIWLLWILYVSLM